MQNTHNKTNAMVEHTVRNLQHSTYQTPIVFASEDVIALQAAMLVQELARLWYLLPADKRYRDDVELGYGITTGVLQDAFWTWHAAGIQFEAA